MKFLFYDVETANRRRNSICAVGWCLVQDMKIISEGYTLINPNAEFDPYCTNLHGITSSDVIGAPTFGQYWNKRLGDLMKDCVVVAHNATSMDICATDRMLSDAGIQDAVIYYFDFLSVSQKMLPECENHKLSTLASWACVSFDHHSADEDARALFEIAKMICLDKGYDSLEEMFIRSQCVLKSTIKEEHETESNWIDGEEVISETFAYKKPKRYEGSVEQIDDALIGCTFCITGDLPMGRDEAERMILEHGGKFRDNVSTKTSFLILGKYMDSGDGYISAKRRKAMELIEQGSPMQIISIDQFLDILQSPETNLLIQPFREETLKKKKAEQEKEQKRLERIAAREAKKSEKEASVRKKPSVPGVLQYSLSGEFIAEFDSVSIAAIETGVNSKCIRDTAKGLQRTAGGFLWKFKPEDE
ncbi:MAG: hypothetical protein IJ418_09205 [Clostridia bacterium]|nr:hypothetical protein [Clostridia bacterium]